MQKIRVGIAGYGNLGRGVELALKKCPDMELVGIFSRRATKKEGISIPLSDAADYQNQIDVMILCGGSATDLPTQGPSLAKLFNTVDSFDTHAKIPEYFESVDAVAKEHGHLSLISCGWDPGLFSLNRLLAQSILPEGDDYTFWGKGISQGHSDAIRRIEGVLDAKQYTIPLENALERVRANERPVLTTGEKHRRLCYVVAEEGADLAEIERKICTMPHYFDEYQTEVHFISQEELNRDHSGMPHGGMVIRTGITGESTPQKMEFHLDLGSNPEFTGSVLVAYARAIAKMSSEGKTGAVTVFDIPFAALSPMSGADLRKKLL